MNSEVDKSLYSNGFLSVKLSPFLDTGKIHLRHVPTGKPTWLWTRAASQTRVLGLGLNFTWGRDVLTGNNAFYFMASR